MSGEEQNAIVIQPNKIPLAFFSKKSIFKNLNYNFSITRFYGKPLLRFRSDCVLFRLTRIVQSEQHGERRVAQTMDVGEPMERHVGDRVATDDEHVGAAKFWRHVAQRVGRSRILIVRNRDEVDADWRTIDLLENVSDLTESRFENDYDDFCGDCGRF